MPGIGVFVCECGPNIGDRLDAKGVAERASALPGVTLASCEALPCSAEGQERIVEMIRSHGLDRIVVAGCSPREHEATFRGVCERAGINGFMLQMANIREQCAWVIEDRNAATDKAMALVKAAVQRVSRHAALERPSMDAESTVLVVGAGVAGIEAALVLAQKGREVYVVEKSPSVGGHANRYEEVFPAMECGSCMLEPKLDELLHSPNIHVLTNAQVVDVLGFYGNYVVKVRKTPRYVVADGCYGCPSCVEACPAAGIPNEFNEGLSTRKAICMPYPGALPNLPVIDMKQCLRSKGQDCSACASACPFGAIDFGQQEEVVELKVGGVVLASGFGLYDVKRIPNLGYARFPEVYTSMEFEHLLSSGGPTGGAIRTKDGREPTSIAFVHCVGSRNEKHADYCSGTCCLHTMKFAHLARKKLPDTRIIEVFSDLALAGKDYMHLYRQLAAEGVSFVRASDTNAVSVEASNGGLRLIVPGANGPRTVEAEMVVLSAAMVPTEDSKRLSELFGVTLDGFGFFQEMHGRLDAVSSNIEGVQIAGAARGPADIQGSVTQGAAAAGKLLRKLVPGAKVELEAITSFADPDVCGGCKMCVSVCPYKAVRYDAEKGVVEVTEALCHGCGTCAAACPSGAMQSRHFNSAQVFAEIEGLLR